MNNARGNPVAGPGGGPQRTARRPLAVLIALAGVLLLAGGLLAWQAGRSAGAPISGRQASADPAVATIPRLMIDRETIDLGRVQVGQMVKATFKLSDGGDLPLKILTEPRVELVKGC